MESKFKTAWIYFKASAVGILVLWVVLFVVRNRALEAEVDWVVGKTTTNVALVILVSLAIGAVVGALVLHLASRRGKR